MKVLTREYWTAEIQKLNRWVHAHPLKACAFSAVLAYLSAMTAVAFAEDEWICGRWVGVGFLVGTLAVFELVFYRDCKKWAASLVIAGLLCAQSVRADPPPPAPIVGRAIAVAVIVGGTWATVEIVKFCRKHFGKPASTNAPPEEFVVADGGEYGAAFTWVEEGYCYEERLLPAVPVAFTLDIEVGASNAVTTARAEVGAQYVQSLAGKVAELGEHGLWLVAAPDRPGESYERDRQTTVAADVPISMDWSNHVVRLGEGGVISTVERSVDLRVWEPLVRLEVPAGTHLRVRDASVDGATFYRVALAP